MADTWKCPACGTEVVAGFGERCIAEHFDDDFNKVLEKIKASGGRIEYDYEHHVDRTRH
jgi:wobble nucleotide-excising tRNase